MPDLIADPAEFNTTRAQHAARNWPVYPEPIPLGVTYFQHHYGSEKPVTVHGWQWSTTFGKWHALVTFADGWHGFTFPARAR